MVSNPDIIILDEPESNLDFKNQKIILNLLDELSKKYNITIIMNTHFINNALRISDYCLLMKKDHYYIFGEKSDVLTRENLENIYEIPIYESYYNNDDKIITAFVM